MDHYIEITLLPDPEFPATVLMNALYKKLHKALFDLHSKGIGVSFPNYEKTLGQTLRLHGTKQSLEALQQSDWIGRMKDYCQASEAEKVPADSAFRTVARKKDAMSNAKLRRLITRQEQGKRGDRADLIEDHIESYQQKMVGSYQKGAYLELTSSTLYHPR